jgi:hypothetical protein
VFNGIDTFGLGLNNNLNWAKLFSEFSIINNYIDWRMISQNKTIPWSTEILDLYKLKLDWNFISKNQQLCILEIKMGREK